MFGLFAFTILGDDGLYTDEPRGIETKKLILPPIHIIVDVT